MEDTVYKILDTQVKKVGERQYEFIASTADIDRDMESIDVNGWDLKNFKKNPVILYGHNYTSLPIGKATKIGVKDGKLMNVVEFPPEGTYEFADIVQRLVDTGYLKTQSVGFIPKKWDDAELDNDEDSKKIKPRRTYTKQELLEISIVPVPSNPNALRNAVDNGIITAKQFKAITEPATQEAQTLSTKDIVLPDLTSAIPDTSVQTVAKTEEVTKPEVTEDYIRIPVSEGHDEHKIRTINISSKEGIKALYCVDCKENITYLFDKEKWTMETAKVWVKEHGNKASKPSQQAIMDEIDYLKSMIDEAGINEDTENSLKILVAKYLKINPYLPEEYYKSLAEEKQGAVLNKRNKDKLNQIKLLAQDVLDSAGEEEEERSLGNDIPIEDKLTPEQIMEIIQNTNL